MSIRGDLAAAARRGRDLLPHPEATRDFVLSLHNRDGGFRGRSAESDLYYTVFGLEAMAALGTETAAGSAEEFLSRLDPESLDLVHASSLARVRAQLGAPPDLRSRAAILRRVASVRCEDGGYHHDAAGLRGSAYGCFLTVGTFQDLREPVPDPAAVLRCLDSLRLDDGSYANDASLSEGLTPTTAGAVALRRELGRPPDARTLEWILARQGDDGGFAAVPGVPFGDLLSTATALHALALCGAGPGVRRERGLAFVLGMLTPQGGFRGSDFDDVPDCEYTVYGLVSLGCLSP
jgi:prenyltransferase beta subunit